MPREFFGHAGRPGQRGGSVSGGDSLGDISRGFRDKEASTYTSSMTSPNMGTRVFMDVKAKEAKMAISQRVWDRTGPSGKATAEANFKKSGRTRHGKWLGSPE